MYYTLYNKSVLTKPYYLNTNLYNSPWKRSYVFALLFNVSYFKLSLDKTLIRKKKKTINMRRVRQDNNSKLVLYFVIFQRYCFRCNCQWSEFNIFQDYLQLDFFYSILTLMWQENVQEVEALLSASTCTSTSKRLKNWLNIE